MYLLFFNWRIAALQCCASFCSTTTWITGKYTYIPSLLSLLPHPISPLYHGVPSWAPCAVLHMLMYICQYYSQFHPTLSFSCCVYKSVPYICTSHWSEWPSSKNLQTISAGDDVGKKGTLLHCWWEYELIQPLWKTVWRFFKKLEIELPYNLAIPLLAYMLRKS